MIKRLLLLTVLAFSLSGMAVASSIALISQSGGTYTYGLTQTANEFTTFLFDQTITLSGLSDVTGASVGFSGLSTCFTTTFSSTSVVLTQTLFPGSCSYQNNDTPYTWGSLIVDSGVTTLGTISYDIATMQGSFSGTVLGPVGSAVPEPTSLALLGTGLFGLIARYRGKFW